jgi:hypothetical protein
VIHSPPPPDFPEIEELDYGEETLDVKDTEPPKLTLNGNTTQIVPQLGTYVEYGVSVSDLLDPEPTWAVTGVDVIYTVEATGPGEKGYELTYTAKDSAGNVATPVKRYVFIQSPCELPSQLCVDSEDEPKPCSTCNNGICLCLPKVEEEVVEVEEFKAEPDKTPPVIVLQGDGENFQGSAGNPVMAHWVLIDQNFEVPGATAFDGVDGQIDPSLIGKQGVSLVDTSKSTPDDAPYVVTYTVKDTAGNESPPGRRRVYVYNPCAWIEGEVTEKPCGLELNASVVVRQWPKERCSTQGLCNSVSLDEKQEATVSKPTITLVGTEELTVEQGQQYAKCAAGAGASAVCDRGAVAADAVEGDLTPAVLACGKPFSTFGLYNCFVDTKIPGIYNLNFTVVNGKHFSSTVFRTLRVPITCPAGERACNDLITCSLNTVCEKDLQAGVQTDQAGPPTTQMTLLTNDVLGENAFIKKGTPYHMCPPGEMPSKDKMCEPGATAMHDSFGNLTLRVLACPPDACMGQLCKGHEFYTTKGVNGCINTNAPVGTVFEIFFKVYDDSSPVVISEVKRSITITTPCADGAKLCSDDKTCSRNCTSLDLLSAGSVDTTPPELTMYANYYQVNFGKDSSSKVSFKPCASLAASWFRPEGEPQLASAPCWAYALDGTETIKGDGDVSSRIAVTQRLVEGESEPCALAQLAAGGCAPGRYTYLYTVSDFSGRSTTKELEVASVQVVSVSYSIEQQTEATSRELADFEAYKLSNPTSELRAFQSAIAKVLNDNNALQHEVVRDEDVTVTSVKVEESATRVGKWDMTVSYTVEAKFARTDLAVPETEKGRRRRALLQTSNSTLLGDQLAATMVSSIDDGSFSSALEETARELNARMSSNAVAAPGAEVGVAQTTPEVSERVMRTSAIFGELSQVREQTQSSMSALGDVYALMADDAGAQAQQDALLEHYQRRHDLLKGNLTSFAEDIETVSANFDQSMANDAAMQETLATAGDALNANMQAMNDLAGNLETGTEAVGAAAAEAAANTPPPAPLAPSPPGPSERSQLDSDFVFDCPVRDAGSWEVEMDLSFPLDSDSDSSSEEEVRRRGRQLLKGGKGGGNSYDTNELDQQAMQMEEDKMNSYAGYTWQIEDANEQDRYIEDRSFRPTRYIARTNRIVGGMMLTTFLSGKGECTDRFKMLGAPCMVEESNRTEYGVDPTFHMGSDFYNEEGVIGDYYNVSDPSQMNQYGLPYAFHKHGDSGGFHVFLDSGVSGQRARDLLQWLDDAAYFGEEVTTITLETMLLNLDLDLLVSLRVTLSRGDNDGMFYPEVHSAVIQATAVSRTDALYGLAIIWVMAHLYAYWSELRPIFVTILVYGPTTGMEVLARKGQKYIASLLFLISEFMCVVMYLYLVDRSHDSQIQGEYQILEDLYGEANALLPKRLAEEVPDSNLKAWERPEDPSGYEAFYSSIEQIETTYYLTGLYWSFILFSFGLQTYKFLLFIESQPRVGAVINAIRIFGLDIVYLQCIWFLLFMFYLLLGTILYGPWHGDMSNLEDAYNFLVIVVLGPDVEDVSDEYVHGNEVQTVADELIARMYWQLTPFLFWVIITNLALGIICDGYDMARNMAKDAGAKSLVEDVYDMFKLELYNKIGIWPSHTDLRRALKTYVKGMNNPVKEKTQQDKDLELLLEPFLRAMNLDSLPGNTAMEMGASDAESFVSATNHLSKQESRNKLGSKFSKSGKTVTGSGPSHARTAGDDDVSNADTQSEAGTSHSKSSKASKSEAMKQQMKGMMGGAGNMLGATGLFSMDALDGASEKEVEEPETLTIGRRRLDEGALLDVLIGFRKKMDQHQELSLQNLASTEFDIKTGGAVCKHCLECTGGPCQCDNNPKRQRRSSASSKAAAEVFRYRDAAAVVTTVGVAKRVIQTFQFQEDAKEKTEKWEAHRSRNKQNKFSPQALQEVREQLDRLVNDQQEMQHRLLKTAGLLVQAQAYGRLPNRRDGSASMDLPEVDVTFTGRRVLGGQLQRQNSVMDSNPLFAL